MEQEYYRKTKIFPIMHVVAIRRELYEQHPWVAQSLYKAFVIAQREAYADLHEMGALKTMLPWLVKHVEDTEQIMGREFWPYGLQPDVRARSKPFTPLSPRARSLQANAGTKGPVCARDSRVLQNMSRAAAR